MTNEEFKYWINGYLILASEDSLNGKQITIIKNHADLVKAVAGDLDASIVQFIEMLDEKLKQHNQVYLSYCKERANELLFTEYIFTLP